MTALAPHLSAYLREHLPRERAVSPHTVKTYANCFVLLVQFAADRLKRRPTDLEVEDLDTDMIMAFLDHVEIGRGSCVRTRNGRLAAIRSFFRYIEYRIPACLDQALRVRAISTGPRSRLCSIHPIPGHASAPVIARCCILPMLAD